MTILIFMNFSTIFSKFLDFFYFKQSVFISRADVVTNVHTSWHTRVYVYACVHVCAHVWASVISELSILFKDIR